MTTSSKVKPTDLCGVCHATRENHGDMNHEFNMDGDLIPKEEPPVRRQEVPARKDEPTPPATAQVLGSDPVARLHLRLIERLVSKGILLGDDLVYIFGGTDVHH